MTELCTVKTASLKDLLKGLSVGGGGNTFLAKFEAGKLSTQMLDFAHCAMAFIEIDVEGEGVDTFAVDEERLGEAIKTMGAETTLSVEGADLTLKSGRRKRVMRLPDNNAAPTPKLPILASAATVVVKSDDLISAIKAARLVYIAPEWEKIQFTYTGEALNIEAKAKIDSYDETLLPIKAAGAAGTTWIYTADYLMSCLAAAPKGADVALVLTNEGPLKMSYDLTGGRANFMIAPVTADA